MDCTLRDGGYYNSWDFPVDLIEAYLVAMKAAQVDVVELGFRFLRNEGFKGGCAYTTDDYLNGLCIPSGLRVAVMVNGGDLCTEIGCTDVLERLFTQSATDSPVNMVRFACHFHEFPKALPAAAWLNERGYEVGFNLMQIADCSHKKINEITAMASDFPLDVLYFADSMGSMIPDDISRVVGWLREGWQGELGIHTHDNMGMALANTLRAQAEGVSWLDATVTGMGRGPGNARTEELVIEAEMMRHRSANFVPLMNLVAHIFEPMKAKYGWGTNPFYYLAGKYGIHPTYIQEMISDTRYDVEDILAVIDHLSIQGAKKYSVDSLNGARQFYSGEPRGTWSPAEMIAQRDVLILGTGPGVEAHRSALEAYVRRAQPIVLALNTQSAIDSSLINLRIACHPVRLLADAEAYSDLPQPLITPVSMLQKQLLAELDGNDLLDFGLGIETGEFKFYDTYCIVPTSLVLAYALAVVTSGKAANILMAGFDGYPSGDPRNAETATILNHFRNSTGLDRLLSVTPTRHKMRSCSIYSTEISKFSN
ncbi:HMGL-like family protein [Synechococcus sp. BMK-MC-1]|nr:HMGL-like family protein [Synechococcus sp. BMK-MC-1]